MPLCSWCFMHSDVVRKILANQVWIDGSGHEVSQRREDTFLNGHLFSIYVFQRQPVDSEYFLKSTHGSFGTFMCLPPTNRRLFEDSTSLKKLTDAGSFFAPQREAGDRNGQNVSDLGRLDEYSSSRQPHCTAPRARCSIVTP